MCSLKTNFDNAIHNIKCFKPNTIFLTAKSCNGKSYFSNILKIESDYKILELDVLVRQLGKKYNVGESPEFNKAFQVYKNKAPSALIREFISKIRSFIRNNEYTIIEGALVSITLINRIFKNIDYTFIYLYPWFTQNYYKRIMKRLRKDLIENTRTVSFWNSIPEEILNKMDDQTGLDDKHVKEYIYSMAINMKKASNKRYKYFKNYYNNIYTVLV